MEKYIIDIAAQIKSATGIKAKNVDAREIIEKNIDWLKERIAIGEEYTDFLEYLGLDYKEPNCAEVGKTRLDSVVLPYDTTMITPDSFIGSKNSKQIINGTMKVIDSNPMLYIYDSSALAYMAEQIPADIIRTYMTQNPYSTSSILGWENLHDSRLNKIIVGIYGSWQDKDLLEKIKQLKAFKNKLIYDDFIEEHDSTKDGYFYVIASKPSVKEHVRTR